MKKLIVLIFSLFLVFTFCSCKNKNKNFNKDDKENIYAQIVLSTGDKINLVLYYKYAPLTVDNFVDYCVSGHYEGAIFHRIIESFMIQGGGFSYKNENLKRLDTKDPIYGEFSDNGWKTNTIKHVLGTISMARTSVNDSATDQFFICSASNASCSNLDGKYAAFGRCTDEASRNVVVKLSKVATHSITALNTRFDDFPVDAIMIKKINLSNEVFK